MRSADFCGKRAERVSYVYVISFDYCLDAAKAENRSKAESLDKDGLLAHYLVALLDEEATLSVGATALKVVGGR